MSPVGFEPEIPVSQRKQTHALDRVAKVTSLKYNYGPVRLHIFKNDMQILKINNENWEM